MKKIIAALDFSDTTEAVLKTARAQAIAFQAELTLVHVEAGNPAFVGYEPGPQTVRDSVAHEMRHDHSELRFAEKQLAKKGIKVKSLLLQGATAEKILKLAKRLPADLLILGTHGHRPLKSLLLGSVSEAVLRKASCPVLLVKKS